MAGVGWLLGFGVPESLGSQRELEARVTPIPAWVLCLSPCSRHLARRRGPALHSTQHIDEPLPLNSVPGTWLCRPSPTVSSAPRNPTQLASAASPMAWGCQTYAAQVDQIPKRSPKRGRHPIQPPLASDAFLRDLGGQNVAAGLKPKARSTSANPRNATRCPAHGRVERHHLFRVRRATPLNSRAQRAT